MHKGNSFRLARYIDYSGSIVNLVITFFPFFLFSFLLFLFFPYLVTDEACCVNLISEMLKWILISNMFQADDEGGYHSWWPMLFFPFPVS